MTQFDVLRALKALVVAALPLADVRGFDEDTTYPETIGADGAVLGFPGDPGEPEVDLSPPAYHYDHEFPLEIAVPPGTPVQALIDMATAVGDAVKADRGLGGLCDYLVATAPVLRDRTTNYVTGIWIDVSVIASYATSDPLA